MISRRTFAKIGALGTAGLLLSPSAAFGATTSHGLHNLEVAAGLDNAALVGKNLETGAITYYRYPSQQTRSMSEALYADPWLPEHDSDSPSFYGIIGSDDRWQITNTDVHLYRSVCRLQAFRGSEASYGSGAGISKAGIATCAHIIYSQAEGWIDSLFAYPGYNAGNPVGGIAAGTEAIIDKNWFKGFEDVNHDFGMIVCASKPFAHTGYFGFGIFDLNPYLIDSEGVELTGYPGDKPEGTMWTTRAAFLKTSGLGDEVWYLHDCANGESGAPLWIRKTGQVCAVHSTSIIESDQQGVINKGKKLFILETGTLASSRLGVNSD